MIPLLSRIKQLDAAHLREQMNLSDELLQGRRGASESSGDTALVKLLFALLCCLTGIDDGDFRVCLMA